jgi:hypothetical protein
MTHLESNALDICRPEIGDGFRRKTVLGTAPLQPKDDRKSHYRIILGPRYLEAIYLFMTGGAIHSWRRNPQLLSQFSKTILCLEHSSPLSWFVALMRILLLRIVITSSCKSYSIALLRKGQHLNA